MFAREIKIVKFEEGLLVGFPDFVMFSFFRLSFLKISVLYLKL